MKHFGLQGRMVRRRSFDTPFNTPLTAVAATAVIIGAAAILNSLERHDNMETAQKHYIGDRSGYSRMDIDTHLLPDSGFTLFNTCFAQVGKVPVLVSRLANYNLCPGKFSRALFSKSYTVILPRKKTPEFGILIKSKVFDAVEDVRLVQLGDIFIGIGTVHMPGGKLRLGLFTLSEGKLASVLALGRNAEIQWDQDTVLEHKGAMNTHEKNWSPIVEQGRLYLARSFNPLILLHVPLSGGTLPDTTLCTVVLERPPLQLTFQMRGNTELVPYKGGVHLTLVHERENDNYVNRFVILRGSATAGTLHISSISRPFKFVKYPVEFLMGLVIDWGRQEVMVSGGVQDCWISLFTLTFALVDSLFLPVETSRLI